MTTKHIRLTIICSVVALLLMIPLVAMQFTKEVNWSLADFMVAGFLLFGTGGLIELVIRKINDISQRTWVIIGILILLSLIWAELAVGIFGTPLAGS